MSHAGTTHTVTGDYFIGAVPVEVMHTLLNPAMLAADRSLAGIQQIWENTAWMNGIQFYLRRNVPIVMSTIQKMTNPNR